MIGMGIDTGGTYTDAVVYDLEKREIMAGAKSLTTREDLKKGIKKAIGKLPEELIKKAEQYLREQGQIAAEAEARRRGASGEIKTEISVQHENSRIESGELFLGDRWKITARGSMGI